MLTFSESLIEEYKAEMVSTYGVVVSDAEAQAHLLTLTRTMFPTPALEGGVGKKSGQYYPDFGTN